MKKEMLKLLKIYIEKYNGMVADLELDERLDIDIKYDKGKKYVLSDVVYNMAAILDVKLNISLHTTRLNCLCRSTQRGKRSTWNIKGISETICPLCFSGMPKLQKHY